MTQLIEFLKNNIGTIIVAAILLGVALAIIVTSIKNKKQGKTSCGCNCSGCAMSCLCQNRGQEENKQ